MQNKHDNLFHLISFIVLAVNNSHPELRKRSHLHCGVPEKPAHGMQARRGRVHLRRACLRHNHTEQPVVEPVQEHKHGWGLASLGGALAATFADVAAETLVRCHEEGNDVVNRQLAVEAEATVFAKGACEGVPARRGVSTGSAEWAAECTQSERWRKDSPRLHHQRHVLKALLLDVGERRRHLVAPLVVFALAPRVHATLLGDDGGVAAASRHGRDAMVAKKAAVNLHGRLDEALLQRLALSRAHAKPPVLGVAKAPELAVFCERQRALCTSTLLTLPSMALTKEVMCAHRSMKHVGSTCRTSSCLLRSTATTRKMDLSALMFTTCFAPGERGSAVACGNARPCLRAKRRCLTAKEAVQLPRHPLHCHHQHPLARRHTQRARCMPPRAQSPACPRAGCV